MAFLNWPNWNGDAIANTMILMLHPYKINLESIIWQSFDGTANFAGHNKGIQAIIHENHCPSVHYIHCRSHLLNLACVAVAKKIDKLKRPYSSLNSLWRFFHMSLKRTGKLQAVQKMMDGLSLSLVPVADTQ